MQNGMLVDKNGKVHFVTVGTKRLTIDENGKAVFDNVPQNALDIAPDTNVYVRIGKAWIGYFGTADYAGFGHIDCRNINDLMIRQNAAGAVDINAKTGQNIQFRINNIEKVTIDSNGMGIGTAAPTSGLHVKNTSAICIAMIESGGVNTDARLALKTATLEWQIYNDESISNTLYFKGGDNWAMKLTPAGTLYVDESYEVFSPTMPDKEGYDWLEYAKEDAMKPNKPRDMKMVDMTDADIEKYGKDIPKIAMANTRLLDYMVQIQKQHIKQINAIMKKLSIGDV